MHNVHAYMHQRRRVSGRQVRPTDFPMRPPGPRLPARREIADAEGVHGSGETEGGVGFSCEHEGNRGWKRKEE